MGGRRRKNQRHPGAAALVALLIILLISGMVVGNQVFVVRSVTVQGNEILSAADVVASSGIELGESMLTLDEDLVRQKINANRYLQFEGVWRDFPDHVVLRVSENMPRATLVWMGMLAMLDQNGLVLEYNSQVDLDLSIPVVTGMQVKAIRIGQPILFELQSQFDAMMEVLSALETLGMYHQIAELNVAQLDNLYLVTYDGLQISLGSTEDLYKKLELTGVAIAQLRQTHADKLRGGELDVSAGAQADFLPPQ